jgi:hypothetical protein
MTRAAILRRAINRVRQAARQQARAGSAGAGQSERCLSQSSAACATSPQP